MKRSEFIFGTAIATTGAVILPNLLGCSKDESEQIINQSPHFKYLEASGTHYEVGKTIGSYFAKEIAAAQRGLGDLMASIKGIVQLAPDVFYDPFYEAAQNLFPDYMEEIKGTADGAGQEMETLFMTNIMMEIVYRYYELSGKRAVPFNSNLGCSSVAYAKNGQLFLAHNEDLFTSFINSMYVVKMAVPGKPEILCLSYPGLLPGLPPAMTEAGIVQSGNDICGLHIEPTVPMVFHFRSVLDAGSIQDAVDRAIIPQRARTMTHNIGSFTEKRIISVEAAPTKHQAHEVDGFYVHTNHFILPEMMDIVIDSESMPSSLSRFDVLTALAEQNTVPDENVSNELFTQFMSSHNGEFPPCVHNTHDSSTLAHAVFDFDAQNWKLLYSNPCLGNARTFPMI